MENTDLKQKAKDFLNRHRKAVFATVDAEGKPHTSLMLYTIDDDFNVYFGTRKAFKKADQLSINPNMSLSVIEEALDPLIVVDIRGVAEQLSMEDQIRWYDYFKSKNPSKYYVEGADDYIMFRIRPTFMRWLDATSGELVITTLLS